MQFLKLTAKASLDLLALFMLRCANYVGKCIFMTKCESMI